MKQLCLDVVLIISLLFCINVLALEPNISSGSAIVYNMDNYDVLYEKNADKITSVAGLSKMMTAIVTLENIENLDRKVTVKLSTIVNIPKDASRAGLQAGYVVTIRDLLYGLILPSGADSALVLANAVSGNTEDFVKLMNDKAKELNMTNTTYANPTGLDEDNQLSTARDVSILLKYALTNSTFREIFYAKKYKTSYGKELDASLITISRKNRNVDISYMDGSKTGYTKNAGTCLASVSNNLLVVTVNAPYINRDGALAIKDTNKIYKYFIDTYSYQNVVTKGKMLTTIKTKHFKDLNINIYSKDTVNAYLPNDHNNLEIVYDGIKELSLKEKKGTKLGTISVINNNNTVYSTKVTLEDNASKVIVKEVTNRIYDKLIEKLGTKKV